MRKLNKIIGIIELNIGTLILTSLFRLFGYKVYYLTISKSLLNLNFVNYIEKFSLFWLSYEKFEKKDNYQKNRFLARTKALRLSKKISSDLWSVELQNKLKKKLFLSICLYEKLSTDILLIQELSDHLIKISGKKKNLVWIDVWYHNYLDLYFRNNIKNICPPLIAKFISTLKFSLKSIIFIIHVFVSSIKKYFFQTNEKKIFVKKKVDFENYKYAYIPKGIIEGNTSKDYFLSNNYENNLHYKKVLVIEVHENELKNKYKRYLDQKKMSFSLWEKINFQISNKKKKELFYLFYKIIILTKNFTLSFIILKILLRNEKNLSNFKKLKKLNYLILGHEIAIPNNILVSSIIKGLKIISFQTRSNVPYIFTPLLINHYFTLSDDFAKKVKDNILLKKFKIKSVGNYKKDQLYKNLYKVKKIKKKLKNKYKFICSIWDYPSHKSWYENGREQVCNYKKNLVLLEETFELAKLFPKTLFIFKNKNDEWKRNKYFKNIKLKLKKMNNIYFSRNWDYLTVVNISDFAYGNQTSALDQMIYLNKPVVIRNYLQNVPNGLHKKDITSKNFKDSLKKISFIHENISHIKKKQNKTKLKFFFKNEKNLNKEILIIK